MSTYSRTLPKHRLPSQNCSISSTRHRVPVSHNRQHRRECQEPVVHRCRCRLNRHLPSHYLNQTTTMSLNLCLTRTQHRRATSSISHTNRCIKSPHKEFSSPCSSPCSSLCSSLCNSHHHRCHNTEICHTRPSVRIHIRNRIILVDLRAKRLHSKAVACSTTIRSRP